MSIPFFRYLVWALRLEFIFGLIALTAYVLFRSEVLASPHLQFRRPVEEPLIWAMSCVGLYVGLRVFCDSGGVAVWLEARGMTRRTQFQTRLATGLFVLSLALLWTAFLIATGLRQAVQQAMGSPWFPMVRWHELRVVSGMALHAIVPFSLVIFLLAAARSEDSHYPRVWATIAGGSTFFVSWSCLSQLHSIAAIVVAAVVLPLSCFIVAGALSVISEQHAS